MESIIAHLFINNWQRKVVALITAIIIWFFVNHSIIETKVIPSVPIKLINLSPDKTAVGLLPNGILSKRVTLTLSGTKDVIKDLEPGDIFVVVDASTIDRDDWVLQLTKKNLVSLNPSIDLLHHVTHISHTEYILKLSKLVIEKIPITILPPIGEAPPGYDYLDIWPQHLMQTLSGPEEAIKNLKAKGLEVIFDLNKITKKELDGIKSSRINSQDDEISFFIPNGWKQVTIPFHNDIFEEINDPEAEFLRIDFLRKEYHRADSPLPIHIYFPQKNIQTINPETLYLAETEFVKKEKGIGYLTTPLYFYGVSRLFVDIVKDYMELNIIAAPKSDREELQWSIEVVDSRILEDMYAAFLIANSGGKTVQGSMMKSREEMLRKRFRDYMQKLTPYSSPDHKLDLDCEIENHSLQVKVKK